jgi:hypothetical protein
MNIYDVNKKHLRFPKLCRTSYNERPDRSLQTIVFQTQGPYKAQGASMTNKPVPLLLGFIAILGCMPVDNVTSDVQSVENFAAGKTININNCSGPYRDTEYDQYVDVSFSALKDAARSKEDVRAVLSAVHSPLKDMFFRQAGGKIKIIGKDAIINPQYCNGAKSCLERGSLTVLLSEESDEIAHSSLLLFADLLVGISTQPNPPNFAAGAMGVYLQNWRKVMLDGFKKDIARSTDPNLRETKTLLSSLATNEQDSYGKQLWINVYDSVYCSDASRANFNKPEWQNTRAAFLGWADNEISISSNGKQISINWHQFVEEQRNLLGNARQSNLALTQEPQKNYFSSIFSAGESYTVISAGRPYTVKVKPPVGLRPGVEITGNFPQDPKLLRSVQKDLASQANKLARHVYPNPGARVSRRGNPNSTKNAYFDTDRSNFWYSSNRSASIFGSFIGN